MRFVERLKSLFAPKSADRSDAEPELIYIVLPEPLQPLERGERYELALDALLSSAGLGEVSGGGSSLSDEQSDGRRYVEWCGIDIDTMNVPAARKLLRHHLPSLGCLSGTQLQYRDAEIALKDEFDGSRWLLGLPRSEMHPGFRI